MKAVLCDVQRIFIEALAVVLQMRGWTVCDLAVTEAESEAAIARHRPHVGLIDLGFPRQGGLATVRSVAALAPATRIVLIVGDDGQAVTKEAAQIGASGFVSKDDDIEQIIATMERVGHGEAALDTASRLAVRSANQEPSESETIARFLTRREREVLDRLVLGQPTVALAADLGITTNTARMHIQNVLKKLGVHSRLQAAAMVARAGYPEGDSPRLSPARGTGWTASGDQEER
ncbi:MAG: LuxR C-terminal-related transcriptional regulator [Frankia sp.]